MNALAQKIQALLYVAGEAASMKELARLTGAGVEEVREALDELAADLEGSGLALTRTDTHAELTTSESVAEFLASFQQAQDDTLSKAASETVALIAYRGPINRYDIDTIRGVDSRHIIRQLLHRGLVREIREAGKSANYDITEEFLQHMGITAKNELPEYDTLSSHERVEELLQHNSD